MENKLGSRLNYVRLVRGDRKINELADKIGISRQALSKIESGATKPNLDALQLIAEELDVSIDYLLGKTDNMNPHAEIRDLHMTDAAEREHLLLLQGAFDEIMDTSADNIKSGEPVDKKETILKMFTLIKEMGALNINPQEINQLTDIVGNMAERIKK